MSAATVAASPAAEVTIATDNSPVAATAAAANADVAVAPEQVVVAVASEPVVITSTIPDKTWRDLDACNGDYDKLGATTTVCPPQPNVELPYWEKAYLIPHEPLRFDLLLLERAVQPQYFQTDRHWKIKRVCHWYHTFFLPFLHHHHDIEETIIFPRYRNKGAAVPKELEADHESLLKQLNSVSALLKRMDATMDEKPLAAMADDLRAQITQLADESRAHFAIEERELSVIHKQYFTPDDDKATVKAIVSSFSMSELAMDLPSVLAGLRRAGGPKLEASFLADLPPPPKLLYRNFWKSQYEVENIQYIADVCLDSVTEPRGKPVKGCGCLRYY